MCKILASLYGPLQLAVVNSPVLILVILANGFANKRYSSDLDDDDVPLRVRLNWRPPLLGPLPPDFLCVDFMSCDSQLSDLELEDERFAILLQNEEFMSELRKNREFLSSLNSDVGFGTPCKSSVDDDSDFKEKLKHMGKVSKKKFSQMARVFTGKKKKKSSSSSSSGGCGNSSSKDHVLLTQDENSTD
uniref:CUE domain-containing protein 1 n=1 Tax=Cacopsylla melanoneura TaxID=428564 RepID=A0A8D8ZWJ0_9HEMI